MKNINFASIQGKYVKIEHLSTSSVIKMTITRSSTDEEAEVTQTIWMDYQQFDSLIDVINSLENDTQ